MTAELLPIPGPAPLPLIGPRADLLRFFADPIHHLLALEPHGPVAALSSGDTALVFAFGAANNQAVLSDPATFRNFVEVPFRLPPGSAASRMFTGIMSMNGDEHRRHRRLLLPVVNKAAVATYAGDIAEVTERGVAAWGTGEPFDVMHAAGELTTTVLMRCLFDSHAGPDATEFGRLGVRLLGLFTSPLTILAPWRIPGSPYASFLQTCEDAEARVRAMIAERGREDTGRRDVMSILLRARDEEIGGLTDDQVIAHMVSMLFAGQDPIAATLSLTLMLLSQHPALTADLADELDAVLAGAPPTPEHLPRLPLLDAVVNESMRVLPAIVHLLFRRPTEEQQLGAHRIPAGSILILSPLVTHRDPALYPDPLRFDPHRWIGAPAPGHYAYLPFGAGPRTCLGAGLSGYILRTQLAMILQRWRPVLPAGTRVDLTVRAANLGTRGPLPLRLVPRRDAPAHVEPVQGDVRRLVRLP